ncbi:MAG: LPS export ABC transporter permease LptF [Gammaproteobacteria bacterium]
MSIIDRYLIKEVSQTLVATVAVLLAMVLSQRLANYLSQAAGGKLATESILLLLGLQAIRFLIVLIPLASLIAIMLALGRLYRDHEMAALNACGFGPADIYRPLLWITLPLMIVLAVLSFWVVPLSMDLLYKLQNLARKEAEVSFLTPGIFRVLSGGEHVVYIGALSDNNTTLRNIFVRSKTPSGIAVTTAREGHQQIDTEKGARYIALDRGHRYEGALDQKNYSNVQFDRLTVRIDSIPKDDTRLRREALPTHLLLNTDEPALRSELHVRLSGPVSLLLIAFIAPLLARARPREGRYGRLIAAILVYTIYVNLLGVGQAWLERDKVPPTLGLWWAHATLLLLGIGLWIYYEHPEWLPFRYFTPRLKASPLS